jgi:hypothetical protein
MKEVLGFVGFVVAVFFLVFWGVTSLSEKACQRTAEAMKVTAQWSIMTDCMIQIDGQFIPLRNVRKDLDHVQ